MLELLGHGPALQSPDLSPAHLVHCVVQVHRDVETVQHVQRLEAPAQRGQDGVNQRWHIPFQDREAEFLAHSLADDFAFAGTMARAGRAAQVNALLPRANAGAVGQGGGALQAANVNLLAHQEFPEFALRSGIDGLHVVKVNVGCGFHGGVGVLELSTAGVHG